MTVYLMNKQNEQDTGGGGGFFLSKGVFIHGSMD